MGYHNSLTVLGLAWLGLSGIISPSHAQTNQPAKISSPSNLYILHCSGCHGMDGRGSELSKVPDLHTMGGFLKIDGGRQFIVNVPGVTNSSLNPAEVASVTNWIIANFLTKEEQEGVPPFTAEEVKTSQQTPMTDVFGERNRLQQLAKQQGIDLPD